MYEPKVQQSFGKPSSSRINTSAHKHEMVNLPMCNLRFDTYDRYAPLHLRYWNTSCICQRRRACAAAGLSHVILTWILNDASIHESRATRITRVMCHQVFG